MGFYVSKDGLYVYSTLDSTLDSKSNKFLTRKGRMYTHYSIKIQRWWREILKNKIENKAALKIQKWWIENKTRKCENEETSILIVPIFIMNQLISFFRYLFLKNDKN